MVVRVPNVKSLSFFKSLSFWVFLKKNLPPFFENQIVEFLDDTDAKAGSPTLSLVTNFVFTQGRLTTKLIISLNRARQDDHSHVTFDVTLTKITQTAVP